MSSRDIRVVIDQLLEVLKDDPEAYETLKRSQEAIVQTQKFSAPEVAAGWKKLVVLMNAKFAGHPKMPELAAIISGKN